MTKTVFDNSMTAHVWASRSQPFGRSNNGNFYFEGRTLFSYGSHFVVGYHMPDESSGLVLLNSDSYSISTSRHQLQAWDATRHMTRASVPGLTATAHEIDRAHMIETTARGRVNRVAKHLESMGWPGQENAALIYRALGASGGVAEAKARAGQVRVDVADRKAAEERMKCRMAEARRMAAYQATRTPTEFAQEAREALAVAGDVNESEWRRENAERKARQLSKQLFRDIKTAKAARWTARVRRLQANRAAVRRELAAFDHGREVFARRDRIRRDVAAIRGAAERVATYWNLNPMAAEGAEITDHAQAIRQCENGATGMGQLSTALRRLARSRYAVAVWPMATHGKAAEAATEAAEAAEALTARAGAIRTAWQRDAVALWREDGTRPPWDMGKLSDAAGGALLRATGVERDHESAARAAGWVHESSGALWVIRDGRASGFTAETAQEACEIDGLSAPVIGGNLHTSWGATVPLTHAVRAFRFLKHCRTHGIGWKANGHTIRVGHFRIDRITDQGDLVAGCHQINWAECAKLATSLGLVDLVASDDALEASRGVA